MHFRPLVPEWIPVIQWFVMLAGLFLGIRGAGKGFIGLSPDRSTHWQLLVFPAFFALLSVNVLLLVFMG